MNGIFDQIDEKGKKLSPLLLRDVFFNPAIIASRGIDSTINVSLSSASFNTAGSCKH